LARYDLNVVRERLEVAREQTNRPGMAGEVRPLLTEDREFQIGRMLDQIDDRDFRKAYREKLADTGRIYEKVHERVHVRQWAREPGLTPRAEPSPARWNGSGRARLCKRYRSG
jgi:hypothetical protein